MITSPKPLILASSSKARRKCLEQLQIEFKAIAPDIDETALASESAEELTLRLALSKAQAVARDHPAHLIIGSDQVAVCNGQIIGKPLNRETAIKQLSASSGKTLRFYTSICLLDSDTNKHQLELTRYDASFRQLSLQEIEAYVDADEPFYCAGSFKMESLGISLFTKLEGEDPNSLLGLPLIKLCEFLRNLK